MNTKAFLLAVTACALGITAGAQAPNGTVYIESNVGHLNGQNAILAFRRDADGHLTMIGQYPTGGTGVHPNDITIGNLAGTLGPFDSDQNIVLNFDGTQLFAVNSGSDTIAVFDVQDDGSLVPIKGSPFKSGGTHPVSLGLMASEDVLLVVNKDYDLKRPGFNVKKRAPNYTAFRLKPDGKLEGPSKVEAGKGGTIGPGNPTPSQAMVSPKGQLVFDADTFGTTIHSFAVRANGHLERVESQGTPTSEFAPIPPFNALLPNSAGRPFVLGLVAHPRVPVFYAGFVFEGKAAVYAYNRLGEFEFVRSTPAGLGICWLATNAAGNRVYTSNTLLNSISVLDTTDPYNPVKLQDFTLAGPPAGSEQLALDVRDEYLFVVSQKALDVMPPEANALHVLQIAPDGTIAAQTDRVVIPVAPSLPQGVAAR